MKKGFSLIELFVIITIIFILLSFIMPLFFRIQESALMQSCKNNLHQLGIAFSSYTYHHRGYLPHSDRDSSTGKNNCWFYKITPYLEENYLNPIKQCPAWPDYNLPNTSDEHSIKMNGALCPKERLPETREDRKNSKWYWPRLWNIRKKSRTVLLLDGRMDLPYNTHTDTQINKPYYDVANRHLSGANILFVDGSCKYVKPQSQKIPVKNIGWTDSEKLIWKPYKKKSRINLKNNLPNLITAH